MLHYDITASLSVSSTSRTHFFTPRAQQRHQTKTPTEAKHAMHVSFAEVIHARKCFFVLRSV
jgi:hypothetical protein